MATKVLEARRALDRTQIGIILTLGLALLFGCQAAAPDLDALPSWNNGAAKQSIVDFVSKVTREGGPVYIAPTERIAVFDNDGTLWSEQPMYFQLEFALDQVKVPSTFRSL